MEEHKLQSTDTVAGSTYDAQITTTSKLQLFIREQEREKTHFYFYNFHLHLHAIITFPFIYLVLITNEEEKKYVPSKVHVMLHVVT